MADATTTTPETGRYWLTTEQMNAVEMANLTLEESATLLSHLAHHDGEVVFEPSCLRLVADALSRAHAGLRAVVEAP